MSDLGGLRIVLSCLVLSDSHSTVAFDLAPCAVGAVQVVRSHHAMGNPLKIALLRFEQGTVDQYNLPLAPGGTSGR